MDIKDKARQMWIEAGGDNAEKGIMEIIAKAVGVTSATVRTWKSRQKWSATLKKGKTQQKNATQKKIEKKIATSKLTEKQKKFCSYYIQSFNATQSAIKAGYAKDSAYTEGYRLLINAEVKKHLTELKELYAQDDYMETKRIVERHKQIAFADLRDYIDENGSLKNLSDVDGTLIKKITVKESSNSQGSSSSSSIELEDRSKSLEFLTKFYGLDPGVDINKSKHELEKQKINTSTKEKLEEWLLSLSEDEINKLLERMNGK
ncbi:MAG: terminase small subunit [Paraclostridium sp.]